MTKLSMLVALMNERELSAFRRDPKTKLLTGKDITARVYEAGHEYTLKHVATFDELPGDEVGETKYSWTAPSTEAVDVNAVQLDNRTKLMTSLMNELKAEFVFNSEVIPSKEVTVSVKCANDGRRFINRDYGTVDGKTVYGDWKGGPAMRDKVEKNTIDAETMY